MQPLGAIGDLEADASCQEEEDEEEEAVWLREQGHCKIRSVQDHLLQGSAIGCSSNRKGGCRRVYRGGGGTGGPQECFVIAGKERSVWVAGRGRGGCRSRPP